MTFTAIPYTFPLWATLLLSLALARFAWSRRNVAGALPLAVMTLLMAIWSFGYIVELLSPDLDSKIAWDNVQILGSAVGAGLLAFSLEHTRWIAAWRKRYIGLLAFPPLMIWMIAWIVPENWLRLAPRLDASVPIPALVYDLGPWLWIDTILGYVFILFSIALLIWHLLHSSGAYRRQTMAALLGVVLALATISLFFFDVLPPYLRDASPLAFTLLNLLLAWSISRYGLLDLAPIARSQIIEEMRDGLIVLDARGRIADINPAAAHIIGLPSSQAVGRTADDIFHPWPHLIERFHDTLETNEEIVIGKENALRRFDLSISPLSDQQGLPIGRVILFRLQDHTPVRPARFTATTEETAAPLGRERPEALSEAGQRVKAEGGRKSRIPLIDRLAGFFFPPVKTDLVIPPKINPNWYRGRERSFTLGLRIAAVITTLILVVTARAAFHASGYYAIIFLFCVISWYAGAARNVNFTVRVWVFLTSLYMLGFVEIVYYGYSTDAFTIFTAFVSATALLADRRGIIIALSASLVTFGLFGWLIGSGRYLPLEISIDTLTLPALESTFDNLLTFLAGAAGVGFAIYSLKEGLLRAWLLEDQAATLLQQERDLLDQRVTERTGDLRASEEKFRALFDQSLDTILLVNLQGRFVDASPSAGTLLGYPLEELKELSFREISAQVSQSEQVFERLLRGEQNPLYERIFRRKDGSEFTAEINAQLIRDGQGNPLQMRAVVHDITERKRAEEQIRKLSQAVEQSADSIVITGKDGDIEYVNPKFEEVTGYSFEEARGKNPRILKSGEQPPEFYEDLWKTITAGKAWRGVFHNKRKDGSLYWESDSIAPILDRNGAITNYVAVKEDITARKEAEENLNRAMNQLEQSNSELKTFAYAISHDLQEPLRMVSSYVQLLARRYQDKLDSDAADFIGFAVEGADRMKNLIDNLMEYSRIGTHGKEFINTDCNQILRLALGNLQLTIEESGARIVADSLPEVLADETQLIALFQNLVGNAVKFHGKEKPVVHIRAEVKDADWVFAIQDNGIGIDPQYAERVFAVFQRLHTREEYPGTGIGLALCKRIVERHGGKIWVESQSGHGATFYFTIPMVNRN